MVQIQIVDADFPQGMTFDVNVISSDNITLTTTDTYINAVDVRNIEITVTMPLTLSVTSDVGRTMYIYDLYGNSGTNNITIDGNGRNINGISTIVLGNDYTSVKMIYNSDQWTVI